jgi:hypothetical protein
VVSHISRKTSEMWGTLGFVSGKEFRIRWWERVSDSLVGKSFEFVGGKEFRIDYWGGFSVWC